MLRADGEVVVNRVVIWLILVIIRLKIAIVGIMSVLVEVIINEMIVMILRISNVMMDLAIFMRMQRLILMGSSVIYPLIYQ